jgi:hypothetical protein
VSMRWLRSSSEAEMVALFLRTELPSDRWKDDLRALLGRAGLPDRVITAPDLGDDAENQARLRLLTEHRGYGTRTEIFDGFPDDVRWQWMAITPAELAEVRYVQYDYWDELSGGSRLAVDAAARIRAGEAPFGVSNNGKLERAQAVASGARFPPLILVTAGLGGGDLVVLEGHVRLTAFMLARGQLPPELEVLVGSSPAMTRVTGAEAVRDPRRAVRLDQADPVGLADGLGHLSGREKLVIGDGLGVPQASRRHSASHRAGTRRPGTVHSVSMNLQPAVAARPASTDPARIAPTSSTVPPVDLSAGLFAQAATFWVSEVWLRACCWPSTAAAVTAAAYSSPGRTKRAAHRSASLLPISARKPVIWATAQARVARGQPRTSVAAGRPSPARGPRSGQPGRSTTAPPGRPETREVANNHG